MTVHPKFIQLMDKFMALGAAGLGDSDEACQLFVAAMEYAPENFKRDLRSKAVEHGLLPEKPHGYSDDGQPLYCLEDICDRLSVDPGSVPDPIFGGAYTGPVHRVQ